MAAVRSLQAIAENKLLDQLSEAVKGYEATANFSCGGSVPIDIRSTTRYGDFTSRKTPITSPLVTIRWDNPSGDISGKISLPVVAGKEASLQQLVKDCQPATFGFGGENVLDEEIRKAGKLEATEFSTSFNPYDYGIVDAVAQALLPGIARPEVLTGENTSEEHWGVVAELYKLNVYSAPSDKFKPHVDTPRGFTQFGSLVVCLPNPHEGGHLRIAHKGIERFFDLGSNSESNSSIQWAAFYSDCEHEVLPVTSGHRITLTYQLYVSEHVGGVVHHRFPTADPTLYPLYESVKAMLDSPAFMKNGGVLGFHCTHQYAHTNGTANRRLPHALKGIDVVLYSVFRSLGLKVHVRPVLEEEFSEEENSDLRWSDRSDEYVSQKETITRAAPQFRKTVMRSEESAGEVEDYVIARFWGPVDIFRHVKWLNDQVDHEIAMAFQQWVGNETETGWWYSFVAILAEVPVYSQRNLEAGEMDIDTHQHKASAISPGGTTIA